EYNYPNLEQQIYKYLINKNSHISEYLQISFLENLQQIDPQLKEEYLFLENFEKLKRILKAQYSLLRSKYRGGIYSEPLTKEDQQQETLQQETLQQILNNLPRTKYLNITTLLKELINIEYYN
ncbi:7506_t:CDS:1, partial [Ambispora leptoticha]